MPFVVTGGRSWTLQTLNLDVFKTEQEKLFVLIFITLCDIGSYASSKFSELERYLDFYGKGRVTMTLQGCNWDFCYIFMMSQ